MKVYDLDIIGERVKSLRRNRRMTQKDIADYLNVTRSCVANWETGKREIDIRYWEQIARLFDVSIEYLCGARQVHDDEQTVDLSKLSDKGRREVIAYYYKILEEEKNNFQHGS